MAAVSWDLLLRGPQLCDGMPSFQVDPCAMGGALASSWFAVAARTASAALPADAAPVFPCKEASAILDVGGALRTPGLQLLWARRGLGRAKRKEGRKEALERKGCVRRMLEGREECREEDERQCDVPTGERKAGSKIVAVVLPSGLLHRPRRQALQ